MKIPETKPDSLKSSWSDNLRFFLDFALPHRKLWYLAILAGALASVTGSLIPLGGKAFIDFIVMDRQPDIAGALRTIGLEGLAAPLTGILRSPNLLALAILSAGLVIGIAGLTERFLMLRFQQLMTFELHRSLFERLLRFPISFFRSSRTGYLVSRVSDDVNSLQHILSESLPRATGRALFAIFCLVAALSLSIKLTLIFLLILPAFIPLNIYFSRKLRGASQHERESHSRLQRELHEVISGVETVKTFGTEETEVEKVAGAMETAHGSRIKSSLLSLWSNYSSRGFQLGATLLVLWAGAYEVKRGTMTSGDYIAFASYAYLMSSSINAIMLLNVMLQPSMVSLHRIREILSMYPINPTEGGTTVKSTMSSFHGLIHFDNVSFAYEKGHNVLYGASFAALPGVVTAITGDSGSGKTTIINLFMKFFTPDSGTIYLDNHNLELLDTGWLRSQVGFVSQDIFLFDDTVENNIKYGSPYATTNDVVSAAKAAVLHDDITNMPDGYSTYVGERGLMLSKGQRQRISIARAILRNPQILIFDEATTSLDIATERAIKEYISKASASKTVLVISHRTSALREAGRILHIANGKVTEYESYESYKSHPAL